MGSKSVEDGSVDVQSWARETTDFKWNGLFTLQGCFPVNTKIVDLKNHVFFEGQSRHEMSSSQERRPLHVRANSLRGFLFLFWPCFLVEGFVDITAGIAGLWVPKICLDSRS